MSYKIRKDDTVKAAILSVLSNLEGWKLPELKEAIKRMIGIKPGFDSDFAKQVLRLRNLRLIEARNYRRYITSAGLVALREWKWEIKKFNDGTPKELFK
jgi:hypothetical protein